MQKKQDALQRGNGAYSAYNDLVLAEQGVLQRNYTSLLVRVKVNQVGNDCEEAAFI